MECSKTFRQTEIQWINVFVFINHVIFFKLYLSSWILQHSALIDWIHGKVTYFSTGNSVNHTQIESNDSFQPDMTSQDFMTKGSVSAHILIIIWNMMIVSLQCQSCVNKCGFRRCKHYAQRQFNREVTFSANVKYKCTVRCHANPLPVLQVESSTCDAWRERSRAELVVCDSSSER